MNARLASSALALTLLLAACGTSTTTPQATEPAANAGTPVLGTANPDAIPGQYIVVFKDDVASDLSAQDASGLIGSLNLDPQGVTIQHLYSVALNGFAAKLNPENLQKLQADPRVKYIEQDGVMHATATQTGATWGLDRIDQRSLPLNGSYVYNATGSGIRAYIIDTGINTAHSNFGGRAVWGTNTTGDGNNSDCQGHGTHVAGTVGGSTWGVAKGATLVAVKVLNCQGSGSNSGVIAGVNWALNNKGTAKAVANMSLGGGYSQAVNDAVNNAASRNLVMVVAAGNENQNACNVSPASAASAITVGSTTNTDARSSFSNFGSCVDIFAPGSNITSTWIGSTSATNTISGTSMASPHVAGAAVLKLAAGNSTTSSVTSAIINTATTGKVTGAGTGSPNRLLYTGN
ncbi:S8 family peptidase [Deinococcus arcticus]|uniref:Serine protease n=1 Tax=Deinococcus arcticus TaxID=2136176 RepID=A0A2T3W980_9DEIO|nr:serine protease [Deinococcus arcticus]